MYDKINGGSILLSSRMPKQAGCRVCDLILVDMGDQYVVARLYHKEDGTGRDSEWAHGSYFNESCPWGESNKVKALCAAVKLFAACQLVGTK